jgi:hypothetical protein
MKITRNEQGYPLRDSDGQIDWELVQKEKQEIADKYNLIENGLKKRRNAMTHLTPKKKRRK